MHVRSDSEPLPPPELEPTSDTDQAPRLDQTSNGSPVAGKRWVLALTDPFQRHVLPLLIPPAFGAARPGLTATTLAQLIDRARALTTHPFGLNFIVNDKSDPTDDEVFVVAARAVRVVELFLWAAPERRLFDLIHSHGALIACQVGSRGEALAAVEAGCDLIVYGAGAGT